VNGTKVVLIATIALAIVLVLGVSLALPKAQPINFTCYHENTEDNTVFTVTAKVDLRDGLCNDEAASIANAVADSDGITRHELNSTAGLADGSWIVNLSWGGAGEELSHVFQAKIFPCNQTVLFNHCR
jgi:hypothetical protein